MTKVETPLLNDLQNLQEYENPSKELQAAIEKLNRSIKAKEKLASASALAIGKTLIEFDNKTFKRLETVVNYVTGHIKDIGLKKTLDWKQKPSHFLALKAAEMLEKSEAATAAHCASILYNYIDAQCLKRGKKGLEKLAQAAKALFDTLEKNGGEKAPEYRISTIKVWSKTGKEEWVEKALELWHSGTPQVQQETLAALLRGLASADHSPRWLQALLTIINSQPFKEVETPEELCDELIDLLVTQGKAGNLHLASLILNGFIENKIVEEEVGSRGATNIFKKIRALKNLTHRLNCTRGLMSATRLYLPKTDPIKQKYPEIIGWLGAKTDAAMFEKILNGLPLEDNLVEPMRGLYDRLDPGTVEIKRRILVAARFTKRGEKDPEGLDKSYDTLLTTCRLVAQVSSTNYDDPLDISWYKPATNYTGPETELLLLTEKTLQTLLIDREVHGSDPDFTALTNQSIQLLEQIEKPDEEFRATVHGLSVIMVQKEPTEETIGRVNQLLQAASKQGLFRSYPEQANIFCGTLLDELHKKNADLVPKMWEVILTSSGLGQEGYIRAAGYWLHQLKEGDAEEVRRVLVKTAELAVSLKNRQVTGTLKALSEKVNQKFSGINGSPFSSASELFRQAFESKPPLIEKPDVIHQAEDGESRFFYFVLGAAIGVGCSQLWQRYWSS